jgi:hypothetical protein
MQGLANAQLQDAPIVPQLTTGAPLPASIPQIVFNQTVTGETATDNTRQQVFTPTLTGRYRLTLTMVEAATDASGATATGRIFNTNSNIAMLITLPSLGLTVVGGSQGYTTSLIVPNNTFTNYKMGWSITVTGTPAGGSWNVNFMVEYLGA